MAESAVMITNAINGMTSARLLVISLFHLPCLFAIVSRCRSPVGGLVEPVRMNGCGAHIPSVPEPKKNPTAGAVGRSLRRSTGNADPRVAIPHPHLGSPREPGATMA